MSEAIVNKLETQIEHLIQSYKALQDEYNALSTEQTRLLEERDVLQALNYSAAEQIRQIVQRIKVAGVTHNVE